MRSTKASLKPRIAIIGPIIIDNKSSGGEGEKLFQKLKEEGYIVYKKSIYRSKIKRLLDTLWFLIIKHNKFDTIILLQFSGKSFVLEFLVTIIAKLLRKKTIGVMHGGAIHEFHSKYTSIYNSSLNRLSEIYTPSLFLLQYFKSKGIEVKYLPNFITLKQFSPPTKTREFSGRILWVRAFHDIYNPEMAILMMAELVKLQPHAKLSMVGPDKGELEKCKQLRSKLNLENNIDFIGFIPNKDLPQFYQSTDIYINTTHYESFGVALMEAAACELPIVSTNVGEIPQIWAEDTNILLCDSGDYKTMSKEVNKLFTDSELRKDLGIKAQKNTQRYTWESIKPIWEMILLK